MCEDDTADRLAAAGPGDAGAESDPAGHIPSLVHDPDDRGASDTTPLFLIGLALYRRATGEADFLEAAAEQAMNWMEYQSPDDRVIVAQLPTSDWRDEQWVLGFGLYVNTLVYTPISGCSALNEEADGLAEILDAWTFTAASGTATSTKGWPWRTNPTTPCGPTRCTTASGSICWATAWPSYRACASARAQAIVAWVEADVRRCESGRTGAGPAAVPVSLHSARRTRTGGPATSSTIAPGEYHNGGIWPFICGFYVAALVAAGQRRLAREKLAALTELVRRRRGPAVLRLQRVVPRPGRRPAGPGLAELVGGHVSVRGRRRGTGTDALF